MRLYNYDKFINESLQSREEIVSICRKYSITNYTINDGIVDVDANVRLYHRELTKLPLKFGKVTGDFRINNNKLVSLEGCPTEVGGHFFCSYNKLSSLEGCPKEVYDFHCQYNELREFDELPKTIKGHLYIHGNPINEVFKLFPYGRWREVVEFLNEYNVIRDGNKVILQALELVYDEIGLEVPDEIYIEGYEII